MSLIKKRLLKWDRHGYYEKWFWEIAKALRQLGLNNQLVESWIRVLNNLLVRKQGRKSLKVKD